MYTIKFLILFLSFLSIGLLAEEQHSLVELVDNGFYSLILKLYKTLNKENNKYYISIFSSKNNSQEIFIDNDDMVTSYNFSTVGISGNTDQEDKKLGKNFKMGIDQAFTWGAMKDPIDDYIPQALITYNDGKNSFTKWVSVTTILLAISKHD